MKGQESNGVVILVHEGHFRVLKPVWVTEQDSSEYKFQMLIFFKSSPVFSWVVCSSRFWDMMKHYRFKIWVDPCTHPHAPPTPPIPYPHTDLPVSHSGVLLLAPSYVSLIQVISPVFKKHWINSMSSWHQAWFYSSVSKFIPQTSNC